MNAQAPTPRIPSYASNIPAALLQLPDSSVPQANNEPDQVTIPEAPDAPQAAANSLQAVPTATVPPGIPPELRLGSAMQRTSPKLHLQVLPTSMLWPVSKWSVLTSNNQKVTQTQCPWKLR